MTAPHPLENRLFRLCILLKLAFWIVLVAVLGKVLWAGFMRQQQPDPVLLVGMVAGLALLQLGASLAWWRARRRRVAR